MAVKVTVGALVVAASFAVSLWALDYLWPSEAREPDQPPSLCRRDAAAAGPAHVRDHRAGRDRAAGDPRRAWSAPRRAI